MKSIEISLAELNPGKLFVDQSNRLGLVTLGDVLNCKLDTLSKKEGFTYLWYARVLEILKEHGLLSEFQQRQL